MRYTFQELKNNTTKDLVFTWNSDNYVVAAGKTELFPDFIAKHGAKKLADQEWNSHLDKEGFKKMQESFLGKVVGQEPEVKISEKDEMERQKKVIELQVNEPEQEFADLVEIKKARRGRPPKIKSI